NGGALQVSHDIESAYRGAQVVYAKSWGALPYFGRWEQEKPIREASRHFIVDEAKMALTDHGLFSHCLPLRRNVKATDAVHGRAVLHGHRRGREPPARAESGDG
ncbi:N-acetylornithine carbamoyltransferase, partial [mine drainage metagenome]